MESHVAWRRSTLAPKPPGSALWMTHPLPLQLGIAYSLGARYTLEGDIPLANAAASTNGFHAEPGCRPLPPPVMVWPSQHGAGTSTLTVVGANSQPPSAKLSDANFPTWPNWRPPTMAATNPVCGSTEASAISSGSPVPLSAFWTAASAALCTLGSRVVWTRNPP